MRFVFDACSRRCLTLPGALALCGLVFATLGSAPVPATKTVPGPVAAAPFDIDIAHSTMNYRVRHFAVSYFYGRINAPEGTFLLDSADLPNSHVQVSIEVKNMDAGNDTRDKFLTGLDFFNAMEFPKTEFKSKSVKQLDKSTWEASGDFSLHGVTKPITVKLEEYTEAATTKFGYRAGFLCTFTIKRSDYGMTSFMDQLGDEVQIIAAIEGARE